MFQSIATDDEKHYQCQNIVFITKPDHYFWNSIGEFNHCLHRWERHSWECWQKHDMTRDNSTFASVAYFELVVLLSDCFTVVPKSWAYIVQSTKCFVLKRETRVGFQPALSEVFCTSKQILSTSSFASLNATFFTDVLFSRISKAS